MVTAKESRNWAKAKLQSGGYSFGTWVVLARNPALIRMVADAGFDHVFIDMEHSTFSWETVGDLCLTARACGITPIVRPSELTPAGTARLLDIGALGIMFHDVGDRSSAENMVSWVHGGKPASRSAAADSSLEASRAYISPLTSSNLEVIVQIETAEGLRNIDEILSVDGIDAVEIGRGDLSTSLGYPLQRDHPAVWSAIDTIVAACHRENVAPGITCLSFTEEESATFVAKGFRSITYGTESSILRYTYRLGLERLRKMTAQTEQPPSEAGR